jgi:hypothetical protein
MKKLGKIILFLLFASELAYADTISVAGFRALPQEKTNWCWAASIQSIFLTKGLEVTQSKIVTAAYGSPVNRTAPGFDRTLKVLNGLAVSTDGSTWEVSASAGNTFPNANWLYNELQNNKPVMIWYQDNTSNHSIIINGGKYTKNGHGDIYWQQISAYDPWLRRNMKIDAANIPRYVYGSFVIELKRLDVSDYAPEETPDNVSGGAPEVGNTGCAKETTPHGYIRQGCEGITKRMN